MRIKPAVAALLIGVAAPAFAGPLAAVGDTQLRQDVDTLKAAGLIRGPVDSWPLPWAQIDQGLDAARDGRKLDPWVSAAVTRLESLSDFAQQRIALEARFDATNGAALARDFGTAARNKVDGSAKIEFNSGAVSVALGVGYRDQRGKNYHFEPSLVTVRLGNWALYGGYPEEWFGPGQTGALLFSNSAKPFPKVGIKRLVPDPINLPVLRWLGPIRLDFFVGALNENRDYRNIIVVGTRVNLEPVRGLEIGLNRAQQLCGQGRPCGGSQILKSFIGGGNLDNANPNSLESFNNQAGNQIAGYDVSYVHRIGKLNAKVYFEGEAEDFDNIVIEQYARMLGATLSGPWGKKGANWQANVEYVDTYGAALFNGTPLEKATGGNTRYPRSLYLNSLFYDGFTYGQRPIGYWTDGDSRTLTGSVSLTDIKNRRWYGSARSTHINITNNGSEPPIPRLPPFSGPNRGPYHISLNSEKIGIFTSGVEWPTAYGDIRMEARYQTDTPNTPGRRDSRAQFEIGYRARF